MSSSHSPSFTDNYQLLEQVGQGGSGTVYKALDRRAKRLVAVKLQSPDASAEESLLWDHLAGLMRSLDQGKLPLDNVVRLLDSGVVEGRRYLVLEWVEGTTLAHALMRLPQLSVRLASFVACSVLRALEALHGQGVIHRDVKPANIFLAPNPGHPDSLQVKLGDLGVARSGRGTRTDLGEERTIVGTPAYMPPEQWNQDEPVSPAADIYALGCTLYEMLCGQRPFPGQTMVELLLQHATAPRPDPRVLRPEIPGPLAALVMRMMAIAGTERPASARDVREALEAMAIADPVPVEDLAGPMPEIPALLSSSSSSAAVDSCQLTVASSERSELTTDSWQLTTADALPFSSELVVLFYPSPIAIPFRRFCRATLPKQRLEMLFLTVESSLRYLVLLGLADLLHCLAAGEVPLALPEHPAFTFLRRPQPMTAGLWLEALRETARLLRGRPERFLRELPEVCAPGGTLDRDLLPALLAGRDPTGFEEFLSQLRFLSAYPLGFVSPGSTPGDQLHRCMGATTADEPPGLSRRSSSAASPLEPSTFIEEGVPFVASPDGERILYLWPLLQQRTSPLTSRPTLYLLDDLPDSTFPYLGCVRYSALTVAEEWRPVLRDQPAASHHWLKDRLRHLRERSTLPSELRLAQRLLSGRGGMLSGLQLGGQRLLATVGRGGFGTVHAAATPTGRIVAVKILETGSPSYRDEVARLTELDRDLEQLADPPGIIRCFESGMVVQSERHFPWYAMEFALGGDLNDRIRDRGMSRAGQPPWDDPELRREILAEFRQILAAVGFLHSRNIVHRDLKPSNVLVMKGGRLCLSDLGLATVVRSDLSERTTAHVLGTRLYRAPEQEQGKDATLSADIYSLGILLAELALGTRPKSVTSVNWGSTLQHWHRLKQLPDDLRLFLLRLTDINPDHRPADAMAVSKELAELTAEN